MKKKALLSSLVTIALCFSLIAGSTFALFTSESQTNISATSATVDVKAVVDEDSLVVKSMGVVQTDGMFETGGTAEFDTESNLTLTYMVPGDSVEFDIAVTNNSNVDILYRVKWSVDGKLSEVLDASANGSTIVNNTSAWSTWTAPASEADKVQNIQVVIELPVEVGNDYQDESAEITFVVEAIQGNAGVEAGDIRSEADIVNAASNAAANAEDLEVTLMQDIQLTADLELTTDTVIDLNGFAITGTIVNEADLVIKGAASASLVITGNGTVTYE